MNDLVKRTCLATGCALLLAAGVLPGQPVPPGAANDREAKGRHRQPAGEGARGPGKERPSGRGGVERGKQGERPGTAGRMMQGLDKDRSGSISFEEFRASERLAQLPVDSQRRLFAHFDKNDDGQIVRGELPAGPPEASANGRPDGMRKMDRDNDGRVSRDEFCRGPRLQNIPLEHREEIFRRMDRNRDGVLDGRDHRRGPRPDGGPGHGRDNRPVDLKRLIGELDKNRDGKVDFGEFSQHPRFSSLSEDLRKDMFQRLDRSGDRRIGGEDIQQPGPGSPPPRMRPDMEGPRNRPGGDTPGNGKRGERESRRGPAG